MIYLYSNNNEQTEKHITWIQKRIYDETNKNINKKQNKNGPTLGENKLKEKREINKSTTTT